MQRVAEAAAQLGVEGQLDHQTKTAVRAKSVLRGFSNDAGARQLTNVQTLSRPIHTYLNRVMKADGLSCKMHSELSFDPDSVESMRKEKEAMAANLRFVDCSNGKELVCDFTDMVHDFNSSQWPRTATQGQKLNVSLKALQPMAAGWMRCVFYFEDPRFTLASSAFNGVDFAFDAEHVEAACDGIASTPHMRLVF